MNTKERVQLYQVTGFSLPVIAKYDNGYRVAESTGKAIAAAMEKLGLSGKRKCEQQKTEVSNG